MCERRKCVPCCEIAPASEPELLEVGDLRRPEAGSLRGREAEEELGLVGDQERRRAPAPRPPSASAGSGRRRSRPPRSLSGCSSPGRARGLGRAPSTPLRCCRGGSLRSRTATSLASRIVSCGSLGKRIESSRTRTGFARLRRAPVDGNVPLGECGTKRRKYGRPQATVIPRPAAVGSNCASSFAARARAPPGPRRARFAAPRPRSVAVTSRWWSGGTTTSTPLSSTSRTSRSTCCSGGRPPAAGREGAPSAGRPARRSHPPRERHRRRRRGATSVASGASRATAGLDQNERGEYRDPGCGRPSWNE